MSDGPPSLRRRAQLHLSARREVRLLRTLYALSSDAEQPSRWRRIRLSFGWWMGPVAAALGGVALLVLAAVSGGASAAMLVVAAGLVFVGAASCSAGALLVCVPTLGSAGWIVLNDGAVAHVARADGVALVALAAVVAAGAIVMLGREPPAFWTYAVDPQCAPPQEMRVPER
jgi:hypothetical protein